MSREASRPRINRAAVASVVAGVLWVYGVASVVAVILGLMALRQTRVRAERGSGLAWTGLVLGALGVVLVLMITPA